MTRRQLHPLAQVFAEMLGLKVRWFRDGVGTAGRAGLVLAEAGQPGQLVVGAHDDDGDLTAIALGRAEVAEFRDALTDWLQDT